MVRRVILLVVVLTLSLSACGNKEQPGEGDISIGENVNSKNVTEVSEENIDEISEENIDEISEDNIIESGDDVMKEPACFEDTYAYMWNSKVCEGEWPSNDDIVKIALSFRNTSGGPDGETGPDEILYGYFDFVEKKFATECMKIFLMILIHNSNMNLQMTK